jgi:hypothetical protein
LQHFKNAADFWLSSFPLMALTKVATRVLSLLCTVTSADRAFSKQGRIHSKSRNRLSNDKASRLVFVHTAMQLME